MEEIDKFVELHKTLRYLIIDYGKESILKVLDLIEPAREKSAEKEPKIKGKKRQKYSEEIISKIINNNPKDKSLAKEMGWTIGTLHFYHYSWKKQYPHLIEKQKKN